MALAWPLVAGLLLAPVFGGRLSALGELRLRALPLFYLGLGLQLIAFPFHMFPWRTPDRVGVILWLVSYGVFILACTFNVRLAGVPFVAAGMGLNLLAICSNGGHMPALPSALRAAGMHFTKSNNSIMAPSPHFAWFVDRWAAPSWVPYGNVFSVGDVLIMVGGVVFAFGAMQALPWLRLRSRGAELLPALIEEQPGQASAGYDPEPIAPPRAVARSSKPTGAADVLIALGVVVLAFGAVKALRRAAALPS
jgi:Family of unknown function (DUF5317)